MRPRNMVMVFKIVSVIFMLCVDTKKGVSEVTGYAEKGDGSNDDQTEVYMSNHDLKEAVEKERKEVEKVTFTISPTVYESKQQIEREFDGSREITAEFYQDKVDSKDENENDRKESERQVVANTLIRNVQNEIENTLKRDIDRQNKDSNFKYSEFQLGSSDVTEEDVDAFSKAVMQEFEYKKESDFQGEFHDRDQEISREHVESHITETFDSRSENEADLRREGDFDKEVKCDNGQIKSSLEMSDSSDTEIRHVKKNRKVIDDVDSDDTIVIVVIGLIFCLSMNTAVVICIQISIRRISGRLDRLNSSFSENIKHRVAKEEEEEQRRKNNTKNNATQTVTGSGNDFNDNEQRIISNLADIEQLTCNRRQRSENVLFSVISFQGGSAQRSHTQMADTILQRKEVKKLLERPGDPSAPVPLAHILVTNEYDIYNLQAPKVTFVFIDHNVGSRLLDDHIRRKAVQRAIEVSGTVIVVYCGDSQSRYLDLGHLFSPRLINTRSNSLLLTLKKRQSFYSIDRQFTYFQQGHLIDKITSVFYR